MNETTAILDACVLYPAPLRDLFMHLAVLDTFHARWTEEIHDEWIRNVLESRPDLTIEQLTRTKDLMNQNARDAVVEGYESLIETLELPDEDDRHVLAAAIHAKADAIVTFNLRDFPVDKLAPFGVEAIHPDAFISSLFDENTEAVMLAVERQQACLRNPPRTISELLETLEANGLKESVRRLRELFEQKS